MGAAIDFIKTLNSPFKFRGRSSRSQYWYSSLFYFIILISLGLIAQFLQNIGFLSIGDLFLYIIPLWVFVYIFVFGIPLEVRRLHDLDMSGWNYFWRLFPIFGEIFLLYSYAKRGTVGDNRFGPDPLAPIQHETEAAPDQSGPP